MTEIIHAATCCNCRANSSSVQKAETQFIRLNKTLRPPFDKLILDVTSCTDIRYSAS